MAEVDAKVFAISGPVFPEEQLGVVSGPRERWVALCASGGGARSLALMVGYFRAMRKLGLVEKASHVSAVSGGAWFSALYTFAEDSEEALLGEEAAPETLSLAALAEQSPGRIGDAATNSFVGAAATELVRNDGATLWQAVCGEAILKPFGLQDAFLSQSGPEGVPESLRARARFIAPRRGPFLVINGTLFGLEHTSAPDPASLQLTPIYAGVPFAREDTSATSHRPVFCSCFGGGGGGGGDMKKVRDDELRVGGGAVSTYAFGSEAPDDGQEQIGTREGTPAKVRLERPYLSLRNAIGISSAALARELKQCGSEELRAQSLDPSALYWPVLQPPKSKKRQSYADPVLAQRVALGDGGAYDNSGCLAALQRGVRRLVLFINSATPLDMSFKTVRGSPNIAFGHVADSALLGLFGIAVEASKTDRWDYTHNHVFERARFNDVLKGLQEGVQEGHGAVAHEVLRVLPNARWGITGDFTAHVLFVYNAPVEGFVLALPEETRALVEDGGKDQFEGFPNLPTVTQNGAGKCIAYTRPQVALLAAQAQFVVEQHVELFNLTFDGELPDSL